MVSQLLKVAETRYATGKGLQQDVLQAQVELSKLLDEKILLQKKQRTLEDKMNELLNREGYTPVVPPKEMEFLNLQLDLETLQKQSLRQNPWIQVRMTDRDISAVEIELAKKNYWPDMDFKVAYGHREKDFTGRDLPDLFTATMTVNVPLWYKNRQEKKLSATQKAYESINRSLQGLRETLPHKVDALVTDILDTQENYRLFSDALLLQSEQWASSSLAAYVVGKVEFNTMINAHIRLLRLELKTVEYLFSIYQKRAELEEVLGGPMESGAVKVE
jgi:outer membrane protein TolC